MPYSDFHNYKCKKNKSTLPYPYFLNRLKTFFKKKNKLNKEKHSITNQNLFSWKENLSLRF